MHKAFDVRAAKSFKLFPTQTFRRCFIWTKYDIYFDLAHLIKAKSIKKIPVFDEHCEQMNWSAFSTCRFCFVQHWHSARKLVLAETGQGLFILCMASKWQLLRDLKVLKRPL